MSTARPQVGPQVGVGAIVTRDDHILLVQRGREPLQGHWAIPGGKLRLGETLQAGAEREIREETAIEIRAGEVVYTCEHIHHNDAGELTHHYVIIDLHGEYLGGAPRAGDDADVASWVSLTEATGLPLTPTTLHCLQTLYPEYIEN